MELCSESMGASVFMSSSNDTYFPLCNLLKKDSRGMNLNVNKDNTSRNFFVTTGCFPQVFLIQLGERSTIHSIKTVTRNCKTLIIERCDKSVPTLFHKILDIDLDENDGNLQIKSNQLPPNSAYFLRFRILSGWHEFVSIHSISIMGDLGNNREAK